MEFHGNIDIIGDEGTLGQISNAGIALETSFPVSAQVGRMVFVNERVWMLVMLSSGDPVWVPMTNKLDTYVHSQDTASSTWTVTHNLNTAIPLVQIYDGDTNKLIIPDDVEVTSNNTVVVTFLTTMSGRAVVMYGDPTIGFANGAQALAPVQQVFGYTQGTASAAWVVKHNLGYYPIVRVFEDTGDNEIQPASIVHDSIFQTTISFSTATSGRARFV